MQRVAATDLLQAANILEDMWAVVRNAPAATSQRAAVELCAAACELARAVRAFITQPREACEACGRMAGLLSGTGMVQQAPALSDARQRLAPCPWCADGLVIETPAHPGVWVKHVPESCAGFRKFAGRS